MSRFCLWLFNENINNDDDSVAAAADDDDDEGDVKYMKKMPLFLSVTYFI